MKVDFLFKYLNEEQIKIDKEEFDFQFNSHPDYPTLLAVSDTLHFLNIKNVAIKTEASDIDFLPIRFIASLKNNDNYYLSFVEKKWNQYSYITHDNKKKKISRDEFQVLFGNIVMLAESEKENKKTKVKKINFTLIFTFLIVLALVLYNNFQSFWIHLFYIFPVIGFIFSVFALKELFNIKSELFDRFCNIASTYDCDTVVSSSKWKIFDKVNFSDLSITFFSFQIISLLINGFSLNYAGYFFIQYVLLIISMPVNLISLYYQKFIEKKWCLICLSIIGILILELIYILIFNDIWNASTSYMQITRYIFIYLSILMIWFSLKGIVKKLKKLKEEELKYNRFKRNYPAFKNNLLSKQKYDLPTNPITIGDKDSSLQIAIITNPYCGSCAYAHRIINDIIEKKDRNVSLSVIFNFDNRRFDDNTKLLLGNIINSKLISDDIFKKAIDSWFKDKDFQKWIQTYGNTLNVEIIDPILKTHKDWCDDNSIHFTPCIFINGYMYPSIYEIIDLQFFIDELIHDSI